MPEVADRGTIRRSVGISRLGAFRFPWLAASIMGCVYGLRRPHGLWRLGFGDGAPLGCVNPLGLRRPPRVVATPWVAPPFGLCRPQVSRRTGEPWRLHELQRSCGLRRNRCGEPMGYCEAMGRAGGAGLPRACGPRRSHELQRPQGWRRPHGLRRPFVLHIPQGSGECTYTSRGQAAKTRKHQVWIGWVVAAGFARCQTAQPRSGAGAGSCAAQLGALGPTPLARLSATPQMPPAPRAWAPTQCGRPCLARALTPCAWALRPSGRSGRARARPTPAASLPTRIRRPRSRYMRASGIFGSEAIREREARRRGLESAQELAMVAQPRPRRSSAAFAFRGIRSMPAREAWGRQRTDSAVRNGLRSVLPPRRYNWRPTSGHLLLATYHCHLSTVRLRLAACYWPVTIGYDWPPSTLAYSWPPIRLRLDIESKPSPTYCCFTLGGLLLPNDCPPSTGRRLRTVGDRQPTPSHLPQTADY